ncbi:hypothetical protein [Vibrio sp. D431a]|uniref:hypothetical protein n=1 Tax=Vibrio sp. D431a TaxID=2837388 RepID=UPI002553E8C0|nr:hypothetical protein [Vibrio sp. D431a]MDK9790096.1 hypothetical protein [Vibrio sp. D431a]
MDKKRHFSIAVGWLAAMLCSVLMELNLIKALAVGFAVTLPLVYLEFRKGRQEQACGLEIKEEKLD